MAGGDLKPIEKRAILNLQKQAGKIGRLINSKIDSLGEAKEAGRTDWRKYTKAISALEKQLDQKEAAIKDVKDGALARGKESPPSKTVMKSLTKSRDRSVLANRSLFKTPGSTPSGKSGMRVAVDRFNELFQQN